MVNAVNSEVRKDRIPIKLGQLLLDAIHDGSVPESACDGFLERFEETAGLANDGLGDGRS